MTIELKDLPIYATILKGDLMKFTRFFFKEIYGENFMLNWHLEEIVDNLTDIQKGITPNLVINMPPRHGKTTLLIFFTAWAIAINPKSRFIYISSSDKLTNENSRLVRSIISHPLFKELFGIEISKDTKAKGLWHTNSGGGIMAATISGQITGFGAGSISSKEFSGAIIIDDPNKIKDFNTELERIPIDRFEDTIRNRRNSENTPIIINQQRTFLNDLSGYFIDGKTGLKFKHIIYPVLIDNKPLWAAKMSINGIESERRNSDYSFIFEAQYMQNPTPKEGTIFSDVSMFELSNIDLSKSVNKIILVDPADEGKDFFGAAVGVLIGNDVYIIDVMYNQHLLSTNKDILSEFIKKHSPNSVFIEVNKEGTAFISYFYDAFKDSGIKIVPVKNTINKLIRILNEEIHIKENVYFRNDNKLTPEYKKFMRDLTFFNSNMKNKNDDAPDVIAGVSKYFRIFKRKIYN